MFYDVCSCTSALAVRVALLNVYINTAKFEMNQPISLVALHPKGKSFS